jgi:hypothetical protein
MDLSRHVDSLREALTTAVAAGGQQAQETARLLSDAMAPAVRLVLMEALSDMAAEVTTALDGATVDVRLRGGQPEIVVTEAPHGSESVREEPPDPPVDEDDRAVVRISLRLPDALKARAEQAAAVAGTSLNSWLGRAVADALRADRSSSRRGPRTYSGFARS